MLGGEGGGPPSLKRAQHYSCLLTDTVLAVISDGNCEALSCNLSTCQPSESMHWRSFPSKKRVNVSNRIFFRLKK